MADDKLPCWRWLSMDETRSDRGMLRLAAISFRPFQNASSRLTLVLWFAMTIDLLTTWDFIRRLQYPACEDRDRVRPVFSGLPSIAVWLLSHRAARVAPRHGRSSAYVPHVSVA